MWTRFPTRPFCGSHRLTTRSRARSRLFFFNDTATTEIYTLSLHDALPIYLVIAAPGRGQARHLRGSELADSGGLYRSEEHTSELQSRLHLVCRLLLEKKNALTVKLAEHEAGDERGSAHWLADYTFRTGRCL